MGGRIAFGLLGDRFGAKRVLVLGLLAQAFGALGYVFVRELAAFYAVATLFGSQIVEALPAPVRLRVSCWLSFVPSGKTTTSCSRPEPAVEHPVRPRCSTAPFGVELDGTPGQRRCR